MGSKEENRREEGEPSPEDSRRRSMMATTATTTLTASNLPAQIAPTESTDEESGQAKIGACRLENASEPGNLIRPANYSRENEGRNELKGGGTDTKDQMKQDANDKEKEVDDSRKLSGESGGFKHSSSEPASTATASFPPIPHPPAAAAAAATALVIPRVAVAADQILLSSPPSSSMAAGAATAPTSSATRRNRGGVVEPFPEKLHRMLETCDQEGLSEIVSFQPHGRAFAIHKPRRFVSEIMPRFFNQSKLTSFQRQLNLYGFKRLTHGQDNGGYWHELFLRGKPELVAKMKRVKVKGPNGKVRRDPDSEPNFYALPPVSAMPVAQPPKAVQPAPAGFPNLPTYGYPPLQSLYPQMYAGYMPLAGATSLPFAPPMPPLSQKTQGGAPMPPHGTGALPMGSLMASHQSSSQPSLAPFSPFGYPPGQPSYGAFTGYPGMQLQPNAQQMMSPVQTTQVKAEKEQSVEGQTNQASLLPPTETGQTGAEEARTEGDEDDASESPGPEVTAI